MSKVTKGHFNQDDDATVRTSSMRINVQALLDRGVQVESANDSEGNLANVYIVFEQSSAINTNPLYEQLIQAGLTPVQATEIVDTMCKAANLRLMYNAIEATQYLQ
jgi:ankyrin repeat protein